MNSLHRRLLTLLGALLVIGGVNWSIFAKERIRSGGEVVYLALEPVDPRSIMQGDYMALRFAIAREFEPLPGGGTVGLTVDERGVASYAAQPAPGALRLRYRYRDGSAWIGTNAYFFEEGTADRYSDARFGKFRVNRSTGEAVLVGLATRDLQDL
jgi:uncharacterized membrane-anchored protein